MATNAQVYTYHPLVICIITLTYMFNVVVAFFLANVYMRVQGLPGLLDKGKDGEVSEGLVDIAERRIDVVAGKLGVEGLTRPFST